MATVSAGRQKLGEGVAVAALAGVGLVALASGDPIALARRVAAQVGLLTSLDRGVILLATVLAIGGAAWVSRRGRGNPALLGATAAVPAMVGAIVGAFRIAPASLKATSTANLEVDLALLGGVWSRAGVAWGSACLGSALAFLAVAWFYALESRRRRLGTIAPAWDQLLGAGVGLVIIEIAIRELFYDRLGGERIDRLQVIFFASALTLAAGHVGRGASRGADLVAAWASVGVVVATSLGLALLDPALSPTLPSPWLWIVRARALIAQQRTMVAAGVLFIAPVVLTLAIATIAATRVAQRRAVQAMGYGLLLFATSAAAVAVVLPELRNPIANQWSRRVPDTMQLAVIDGEPTSCGGLSMGQVLFVHPERLILGLRDLGPTTRLDDPASCQRLADELPGGTVLAFDRRLQSARMTCLWQALAPRTCDLRWVGARSRSPHAPACVETKLAGGHCATDGKGVFVYLRGAGRAQVVGASGTFHRSGAGIAAVALAREDGGRVGMAPAATAADIVSLAGDVSRLAGEADAVAPFRVALPEPEASSPPPVEQVLPFRSTIDLTVAPEPDAAPRGLELRTDRLRRCEMKPTGWPPAVIRGRHLLRFDEAGMLVDVWRTALEPQLGASACVRRALAKVPFEALAGELATLTVEVHSLLPRVEMQRYEGLEGEAEAAFIELRDRLLEDRARLDACYLGALERDPATQGSFPLPLVRGDRGYVHVPFVAPEAPAAVARCVASVLQELRWPPPPAPETLDVVIELALPN